MLTIDTLHVQLPPGLEHRADAIVRRVASELSRASLGLDGEHRLPRAELSLELSPALPDGEIASRIASALLSDVRSRVAGKDVEPTGGDGW
jgi:hypothetical protein